MKTEMNFGEALEAMKAGKKARRAGWNGKGMFLYLVTGTEIPIDCLMNEARIHVLPTHPVLSECDATQKISSHVDMKAADGSIMVGWSANQFDMLSEDWMIVE